MATIPREKGFDSSLALLRDGFTFIQKRCQRHGTDLFRTRIMLQKTICMTGEEAARLFYDPERFIRKGAIPKPVQKTLLGEHSIMTLDDQAHHRRKGLLMSVMTPESIQRLMDQMDAQWRAYTDRWAHSSTQTPIVLFQQAQEILCRSACAWAGVPLNERDVRRRTRDLAAMVDAFGAVGYRHFKGRWARQRTERWIQGIIEQIRNGQLTVPDESPAHRIALHREPSATGAAQLMDARMAAIELINLIRPTVAISWYITFSALALHQHPEWRQRLQTATDEELGQFVNEIRRFYPFAPLTGARVRDEFVWQGYTFPKGTLVTLDIYGTNRDARLWPEPNDFRPDRFQQRPPTAFNLIPQGGGDYMGGHRCAGEWITIATAKLALRFLTRHIRYDVPPQDLRFSLGRMPTIPRSGFQIRGVRLEPAVVDAIR